MHNSLMNQRKPIKDVIQDPQTSKAIKEKLALVGIVLEYAGQQGLNAKNSYEYFIDLEQDAISYVVYAAEELELKSKTWWFPVVGEVPYLGFFNVEDRDAEAARLKQLGYDVAEGKVGAFSSLGWFEDPLFSSMLNRKSSSLVHLLFHELTHRSYWSVGSVQFNENLAEFVAQHLTQKFFKDNADQQEFNGQLQGYLDVHADKRTYQLWLKDLIQSLTTALNGSQNEGQKRLLKKQIFAEYLGPKFPQFLSKGYEGMRSKEWNNAVVLSASLYSPDLAIFEKAFSCTSATSMGQFLELLKEAEELLDDNFAALKSLCPT